MSLSDSPILRSDWTADESSLSTSPPRAPFSRMFFTSMTLYRERWMFFKLISLMIGSEAKSAKMNPSMRPASNFFRLLSRLADGSIKNGKFCVCARSVSSLYVASLLASGGGRGGGGGAGGAGGGGAGGGA